MFPDKDLVLLQDLLEHARELQGFTAGVSKEEYLAQRSLQLISERLLEILGEAAGALQVDTQEAIDADWRGLRGLRNVLAHQYGHIEHRLLWAIITDRVPDLVQAVEEALGQAVD